MPSKCGPLLLLTRSLLTLTPYLQLAQTKLTEIVSAIEFWDHNCLQLLLDEGLEGCRDPLGTKHSFYVLIETSGSDAEHDTAKLMRFLEGGMASGSLADGEYIYILYIHI